MNDEERAVHRQIAQLYEELAAAHRRLADPASTKRRRAPRRNLPVATTEPNDLQRARARRALQSGGYTR